MKIFPLFVFIYFGILFNPLAGKSNDDLTEKANQFNAYFNQNFQEIIYIHTDKQHYITGEHIRFKVYCHEKLTSKPSGLSKVAYIELLDNENNPQLEAKIELLDGSGFGEIYIPTNLGSGNFILRGYTRWMRNSGAESYFHTLLTIINPFKRLGLVPVPGISENSIEFYPESGSIISGVETKVVFVGKNGLGNPIDFAGKLFANDTILVNSFKPLKNGLGSFEFTPDTLHKYHVELMYDDSSFTKHTFPSIKNHGFSMHITETDDSFHANIFCNDPLIAPSFDQMYLIFHQKGNIIDKRNIILYKEKASFDIDKSLMIDGVASIALFNSAGTLIEERRIFKYTYALKDADLTVDNTTFKLREKVTIDVPAMIGKLPSEDIDLSVSISSFKQQFSNNYLNITDFLLLGNSLKYVYNLGSFFEEPRSELSLSLNNLLIAYPAENSVWKYPDPTTKVKYIPEYRGQLVTAKLQNKSTKEPVVGIMTYLSIPGKNVQFYAAESKTDGSLTFELKKFYGKNELVIQNNYSIDSIYSVELDDPFSRDYIDIDIPIFNLDDHMADWIQNQSQNMQIENSYSKYRPELPLLTRVDSSYFYYVPDTRYYLDDYTRFVVMEEVMREYISGVNVRKNKDGFSFRMLDSDENVMFEENPLILLDGIPVFNPDEIIAVDPLKIERIETIKRKFHKGLLNSKGIVIYTTYAGNMEGYSLNKNAMVLEYDAVQPRKQYYFPDYATSSDKRNRTPDFRNTLYWDPRIVINEDLNTSVEFFTSDDVNSYEVRIEGVDKNGNTFSGKATIEVNESGDN